MAITSRLSEVCVGDKLLCESVLVVRHRTRKWLMYFPVALDIPVGTELVIGRGGRSDVVRVLTHLVVDNETRCTCETA